MKRAGCRARCERHAPGPLTSARRNPLESLCLTRREQHAAAGQPTHNPASKADYQAQSKHRLPPSPPTPSAASHPSRHPSDTRRRPPRHICTYVRAARHQGPPTPPARPLRSGYLAIGTTRIPSLCSATLETHPRTDTAASRPPARIARGRPASKQTSTLLSTTSLPARRVRNGRRGSVGRCVCLVGGDFVMGKKKADFKGVQSPLMVEERGWEEAGT